MHIHYGAVFTWYWIEFHFGTTLFHFHSKTWIRYESLQNENFSANITQQVISVLPECNSFQHHVNTTWENQLDKFRQNLAARRQTTCLIVCAPAEYHILKQILQTIKQTWTVFNWDAVSSAIYCSWESTICRRGKKTDFSNILLVKAYLPPLK